MATDTKKIVDQLGKMTVLELVELKNAIDGAAAEEQSTFDVVITSAGDKKIQVIKVVRALTNLGLKEAKDLVDGAPNAVKEGVAREEADQMKTQLEEAGATVELK
jgi:large subunit ribosomal protein L7/L12